LDHFVGPECDFDVANWPHHTTGALRIYAVDAIHPTDAYIIRCEESSCFSVVYSGGTAPASALARIAAAAHALDGDATWAVGVAAERRWRRAGSAPARRLAKPPRQRAWAGSC